MTAQTIKAPAIPEDILETTNKLVNDYVNPHEPRPDFRPDLRRRIAAALFAERGRCATVADRYGKFEVDTEHGLGYQTAALNIAAAIRKGGA